MALFFAGAGILISACAILFIVGEIAPIDLRTEPAHVPQGPMKTA
jgi:hypothetical protein